MNIFIVYFDGLYWIDAYQNRSLSIHRLRDEMLGLIQKVQDSEYSLSLIYPLIAFVDEVVLVSHHKEKDFWQSHPLQQKVFNTVLAGTEFYQNIYRLVHHHDYRTLCLYYLILLQGFRGQYFIDGEVQRRKMISSVEVALKKQKKVRQDNKLLFQLINRTALFKRLIFILISLMCFFGIYYFDMYCLLYDIYASVLS